MELATVLSLLMAMLTTTEAHSLMTRQRQISHNSTNHNIIQQNATQFCSSLLKINNLYYSLYEHRNISGIPADFSIHWKTGNVFFTLIDEEMKMNLVIWHPSGEFKTIRVTGLGQSTAVDNLNDKVYLATDNGVYKYEEDDDSLQPYTALDKDVMYVAVSDNGTTLYIATWPQNRVHKITNGGRNVEAFPLIPNGHNLAIDTNNNMYFVAAKTTYILKNGNNIASKIQSLPSEITGVFINRAGKVYAMDENSYLYEIEAESASARSLGSFRVAGVNAFAIDSAENVLIGVQGAIMKFKAYQNTICPQKI